jgi:hypothetical protein
LCNNENIKKNIDSAGYYCHSFHYAVNNKKFKIDERDSNSSRKKFLFNLAKSIGEPVGIDSCL